MVKYNTKLCKKVVVYSRWVSLSNTHAPWHNKLESTRRRVRPGLVIVYKSAGGFTTRPYNESDNFVVCSYSLCMPLESYVRINEK